jgi:hypothetical protein
MATRNVYAALIIRFNVSGPMPEDLIHIQDRLIRQITSVLGNTRLH